MHHGKIVTLRALDRKFLRCSIRVLVSHLKAMLFKKLAIPSDVQVQHFLNFYLDVFFIPDFFFFLNFCFFLEISNCYGCNIEHSWHSSVRYHKLWENIWHKSLVMNISCRLLIYCNIFLKKLSLAYWFHFRV